MRAVRGTIGIEGTHLSEAETGEILDSPGPVLGPERAREEREARNAADVMRFVADSLARDPGQALTEELVRDIHFRTTRGIDYPHNTPGRYREHGVSVGTYFAPEAADVPRLMRDFLAWFRSGPIRAWPAAIRAIAAHFYLVSIHPFGDGNGRTSRAAESFILYQAGINRLGFYSLANFYYRQRPEYIEMLDQTRSSSMTATSPSFRDSRSTGCSMSWRTSSERRSTASPGSRFGHTQRTRCSDRAACDRRPASVG